MHDVSLDLIRSSHDVDQLLDGVLEEYERRLKGMSAETLGNSGAPLSVEEAKKLRALVMFAGHAAALKEKAQVATQMRRRAEELERVNAELQRALAREEQSRRRLDDVLAALDAGIMVVGGEGRVQNANRAASDLTGVEPEKLVGHAAQPLLGNVRRGANGEVISGDRGAKDKVVMVARRALLSDPQAEVVLLSDVTERDREMEERHRHERFSELLRTLGVLSHKINNPLTSLLGRAQLLRMRAKLDPDVRKASQVIEDSAKRIAEYIRELAAVVKDGKAEALQPLLELEDRSTEERTAGK
jgi:two-component system sensor histidine kinase FlrB